MASSLSGTVRPSILAVEAFMTSSNLVDCMTGSRQQIKHVDARALKAYELRCARGVHPALGAEGNALGVMKQVVRVISLLDGGQPGQVCTPISVRKILQIEIAVVHVSRAG
jgi:hypothetical protein